MYQIISSWIVLRYLNNLWNSGTTVFISNVGPLNTVIINAASFVSSRIYGVIFTVKVRHH